MFHVLTCDFIDRSCFLTKKRKTKSFTTERVRFDVILHPILRVGAICLGDGRRGFRRSWSRGAAEGSSGWDEVFGEHPDTLEGLHLWAGNTCRSPEEKKRWTRRSGPPHYKEVNRQMDGRSSSRADCSQVPSTVPIQECEGCTLEI